MIDTKELNGIHRLSHFVQNSITEINLKNIEKRKSFSKLEFLYRNKTTTFIAIKDHYKKHVFLFFKIN